MLPPEHICSLSAQKKTCVLVWRPLTTALMYLSKISNRLSLAANKPNAIGAISRPGAALAAAAYLPSMRSELALQFGLLCFAFIYFSCCPALLALARRPALLPIPLGNALVLRVVLAGDVAVVFLHIAPLTKPLFL